MKKIILLVFGLSLLTQSLIAQSNVSNPKTDENAPGLRLSHSPFASLGLIYGGIGYDCRFRVPNSAVNFAASLSTGAGFFWFGSATTFNDTPLSATVLFGKGWHAFETGVTFAYVDTRTISDAYYVPDTHDKFVASMFTMGYRLQAPKHGIFMKVYGGFGTGLSNRSSFVNYKNTVTPTWVPHAFLRLALGYSF
jgi:hypothetical protein